MFNKVVLVSIALLLGLNACNPRSPRSRVEVEPISEVELAKLAASH